MSDAKKIANKKYYEKRKLKLSTENLNQSPEVADKPAEVADEPERTYTFSESELRQLLKNSAKERKKLAETTEPPPAPEEKKKESNFFLPPFATEVLKSMVLLSLPPLMKLGLGVVGQKYLAQSHRPLPKPEPTSTSNTLSTPAFVYGSF